ncbi:hypothetical protein FOL47_008714 [Perkinsus chesapeaki]|uniref:Uncharacterized protein n=1 Tax=Perkinsus chesapeaki TaxID=330153 RepID=A0A7J6LD04_PERCH|nr:hypothetical protein FOL47_008714 [Perkinsus chesapeaki]
MSANLVNAVVHELAAHWNRRALQKIGKDACPITDLRDWTDFQGTMGSMLPNQQQGGLSAGSYRSDNPASNASFGLDYAADLHQFKLLSHVVEEGAFDMADPKLLKGGNVSSSTGAPTDVGETDSDTESIWFETQDIDELDIGETLGAVAKAHVEPSQPSSSSQQNASRISDLRRQSIKFRESIFKTQSPLSNTRSATLFRQLDAKYQSLDAADQAVRIWAEFELQRNVDVMATSSRAGALPASERIVKTSITWCIKAVRSLSKEKDAADVSGGGPTIPAVTSLFDDVAGEYSFNPEPGNLDREAGHSEEASPSVEVPVCSSGESVWRSVALDVQSMIKKKELHIPKGVKRCGTCGVPFNIPDRPQTHPYIQGYRMYRYCPLTTHSSTTGYLSLSQYIELILPGKIEESQKRKRVKEGSLCSRCEKPLSAGHMPLTEGGYTVYWCPDMDGSRWSYEKWRDTPGLGPRVLEMVRLNAGGRTKKRQKA